MTRKSFADRADDSVRWTGIPRLLAAPAARRPRRWWPALFLLVGMTGMVAAILDPAHAWRAMLLLVAAVAGASIVRQRGPLFAPFGPDRPDERERDQYHRATAFAGFVTWTLTPIGLIALGSYAQVVAWSVRDLASVLTAAAFLQMACWAALPTLYASWTMTSLDDD